MTTQLRGSSAVSLIAAFALLLASASARATPTENIGIRVLPAPNPVVVDGKINDWDLSGSVFASDDVEKQRDSYAVWFSAMYDRDNLYLLARFLDPTPLNNPGQTVANYGFAGDSLQVRVVTHPNTAQARIEHFTAWRGADGTDIITQSHGAGAGEGEIHDIKPLGALQALRADADGKGYAQELAIPWKLLTKNGAALEANDAMQLTIEPNFTTPSGGRLSVKDIFQSLPRVDRVFTFMATPQWGTATLEPKGHVLPRPVRLVGGREFPVTLENGVPVADWSGLMSQTPATALPGFKPIQFSLPQDGNVSLVIKNSAGQTVRSLLAAAPLSKGPHTVMWDGLTTPNAHQPGQPVPAGDYTWKAIYNTGLGLKLRGWADNAGSAPWNNGPTSGWGGDQGDPSTAASDGTQVYLGWTGAEAGRSVVATDFQGNVKWRNIRGGFGGVEFLTASDGVLYVLSDRGHGSDFYKLNTKDGSYITWGEAGAPDAVADLNGAKLWPDQTDDPQPTSLEPTGLGASGGKVYLCFAKQNGILVLDAKSGKVLRTLQVAAPGQICAANGAVYVLSAGTSLLKTGADGATQTIVTGLTNATSLAVGPDGRLYVGLGDPDNQVRVFDGAGQSLRIIGRRGGRPLLGQWQSDGMRFIAGLTVDGRNQLWVAERDAAPKRISVWNAQTGALIRELFGPSGYGAKGGSIDPLDPNVMAADNCEWILDAKTGRGRVTAVIDRRGAGATTGAGGGGVGMRFGVGNGNRLYLAMAYDDEAPIYERVGAADYRLRARFRYEDKDGARQTRYWADDNGDQKEQPDEVTTVPGWVKFDNWYLYFNPDMTIYSGYNQFKVSGFTPAGAPRYDLAHPIKMPNNSEMGGMSAGAGVGSADGKFVLYNGAYGENRTTFNAYDIGTGEPLWSYPNNFVGVHGSHNATPPETGMIRGAYDIGGVAKLPAPVGNIWVIPTNVSEWHILNEDGLYVGRLFQPDPFLVNFPPEAVPGADMTNAPPGAGGEDFGGSTSYDARTNTLYIQAGKTAYWNLEATGLDAVKSLPGGKISLSSADTQFARGFQESQKQALVAGRKLSIKRMTPTFSGDIERDFSGTQFASFEKGAGTATRAAMTYDDANLYVAWDVHDATPFVNAATAPENLYLGGDTVDLQLGTNSQADLKRTEAGTGDVRVSIGSFAGQPLAMLYRRVSAAKKPMTFHSGVVANYPMDFVAPLQDAKFTLNRRADGYTLEVSIPLATLGLIPGKGATLRGDVGVTFGNESGRTRLRSYWSNQHTGIVDDAVFELQMEPSHWGVLQLEP